MLKRMVFLSFSMVMTFFAASAREITFSSVLDSPKWRCRNIAGDKTVKLSATRSIRLCDKINIFEVVELEPNRVYELTYYVKGKDIASENKQGAWMMISRWDGKKKLADRITTRPGIQPETGTFDWRKGSYLIDTAKWGTRVRFDLRIAGKGTVWYDEIRLTEKAKKTARASFRNALTTDILNAVLCPRGVKGFFDPGQQVEVDVFAEKAPHVKELEYAVRVKDESGKVMFTLPRRKLEKSFTVPGQGCGYYVMEAEFYADNRKACTVQSGFAVNRKFERRDPFFQVGGGFMGNMRDGYKRIGIGAVSLALGHWEDLSKTPEELLKFVGFRHFLDEGGFVFRACFNTSHIRKKLRTKAELEAGYPLLNDELVKRAREFVTLAVKQADGRVRDWTIQQETPSSASHKQLIGTWSESMANLVVLTRIVSRTVRKNLPNARIFCGGNNVQQYIKDVERITLSDLVDEFDRYIIDAYTGNWDMTRGKVAPPESQLMSMYLEASALSESLGKGKIIGNEETGYCIDYGAPFDRGLAVEQAELTARLMILTKAAPVSHFELHKPNYFLPGPPKDSDPCMCTCWKPALFQGRLFQLPLPGGAMYATAAAQLSFTHSPRLFSSGDFYSCVFTRPDGASLLVLWNISQNVPLDLTLPADALRVNMYGRETNLKAGRQTLIVGPAPVYLTLRFPAEKLSREIRAVLIGHTPEVRCAGYSSAPGEAAVFFRNMLKTTVKGMLKMHDGTSLEAVLPPDRVTVLKVKTRSMKGGFTSGASGRSYPFALQPGNFYPVPKLSSKPVFDGSGAWFRNLPEGSLRYPEHIRPVSALQQELCYFKCPMNPNGHSVSAKYRTAYDDDHFYLAAEVDDPVHQQRYSGSEIWKDDCLQLAFASGESVPSELLTVQESKSRELLSFGAALTVRGPVLFQFGGKNPGAKSWPVKVTRKNGRTFYEVAIPFRALGGRPKRFGFVIFDNNSKDKAKAPYWLQFSDGIAGGTDPCKLKMLQYQ